MNEDVEARIREWVALFDEAETRVYWISLSARQMDAAIRMLKVGRPIERPVQTELVHHHYRYQNYFLEATVSHSWGAPPPMGFAQYIMSYIMSVT